LQQGRQTGRFGLDGFHKLVRADLSQGRSALPKDGLGRSEGGQQLACGVVSDSGGEGQAQPCPKLLGIHVSSIRVKSQRSDIAVARDQRACVGTSSRADATPLRRSA
jgi:hypothetical protein